MSLVACGSVEAYATKFGQDANNSSSLPLAVGELGNSLGAQGAFLAQMSSVGTEYFESATVGATGGGAGLAISFPGFGASTLTATLKGTGSVQQMVGPSNTDAFNGRYSVPEGKNYWDANLAAGNFTIEFGSAIAAFGFFGTDIGDFAGSAIVDVYNGANLLKSFTLANTTGNNVDGSALYFGFIAENTGELFTSVKFRTTFTGSDVFGFDGFTIAEARQLNVTLDPPTGGETPEPTTLALVGVALLGAGLARRRT